MPVYTC